MATNRNFLDSDPSLMENNLKFVKNDMETAFDEMLGGAGVRPGTSATIRTGDETKQNDFKIVTPTPGLCIKCFKVSNDEKFFINLCQTEAIPAPEDITEDALTDILQSDSPSSYRIPMSISQPRLTKDRSDNTVDVCDIAINPIFFKKCENQLYFRDFLIALVLEALDKKYNVQIKTNNWLILKNRKLMGTLIQHRVQNRDVRHVYESSKNSSTSQRKLIQEIDSFEKTDKKILIEEIADKDITKIKSNSTSGYLQSQDEQNLKLKEQINDNFIIPEHKIFSITKGGEKVEEILAELFLPECFGADDIKVDIGEDRICVESRKQCYLFDKFLEYVVDQEKTVASFDKANKMLQIRMITVDTR